MIVSQVMTNDWMKQQLVERDARLSVLRSRLDMVERENEMLKRERGASGASASASGGGASRGVLGGGNYGNANGANGVVVNGAPAGNAANAVAKAEVQELKQELSKLRSLLAFKEEETLEARRAEDDSRAKLRESDAERTRLAAEVRAERRARATAGQKRPGSANGVDESQERGKRSKPTASGVTLDASGALGATGTEKTHIGDIGDDANTRAPRTLALSLPMAPPDVAAALYQRVSSGGHRGDSVFARLMHEVPLDVSAFLAKPSESSPIAADLVDSARVALMTLATNPDSTATLTRALIETIERTSVSITTGAHYVHAASVIRILSALVMIDARSMSIVLGAFGAQRSKEVVSVTAHGAPPAALAGIPGLGGAGMGTLIAHPRAQSDRIFVPAPPSSSSRAASKNGSRAALKKSSSPATPAPLLETFTNLLCDAKNDAQWLVVDAILVAFIRFANGVGVESGRGAFGAVARKGSGFGSCLKPVAPSRTRFLALMLTRVLAPTPEFQSFIDVPLEIEPGVEKPYAPERKDSMTLFVGIVSCLRADCLDENTTFAIKSTFVVPLTPVQSGTLQEAALRVLATLAFVGWPGWSRAARDSLDVLAAVAVEEYVSPLPISQGLSSAANTAVPYATMLVHALLSDDYRTHSDRLSKRAKSQRVVARLAHLSSAVGGAREARLGDWLTRILHKIRDVAEQ